MKKIIKIDGMACEHCENAVKTALEEIDGVKSAKAGRKKGNAVVKLTDNVDDELLKEAVTQAGFTPTGIEEK